MEIKRIFYLIMLTCSLLILCACSDKSDIQSTEASAVDEYEITEEYYEDVMYIVLEFVEYIEDNEMAITPAMKGENAELYLSRVKDEELIPVTIADNELHIYASEFKLKSQLMAENMLDYGETQNPKDMLKANEYFKEAREAFDMIKEIAYKYGLE